MKEIGKQLKQARLDKKITLTEIASRTNINIKFLQDIEQGNFDFLPRPYVNGFIKNFAAQVDLNGNHLIASLNNRQFTPSPIPHTSQHSPTKAPLRHYTPSQPAVKSIKTTYWREISLGIGIFLMMALLLTLLSKSPNEKTRSSQTVSKRSAKKTKAPVKEIPFSEMAKEVAEKSSARQQPIPQDIFLTAIADDTVWIGIVIDDADTTDSIFYPGTRKTWHGKTGFRLRIGNAGVVRLSFNGKDYRYTGKDGQIADLYFNRSGIIEKKVRGRARLKPKVH